MLQFRVCLEAIITKEGKWFIAAAPSLQVASQGETEDGALANLREAVQLFITSCYERGTLETVLSECGFDPDDQQELSSERGQILDIPLPLLVQRSAENRAC